jgi:hypothetical protein
MIHVCPILQRTWWRVKTFLFPWIDQANRPPDAPRMEQAEEMLRTAIFDLREVSRK